MNSEQKEVLKEGAWGIALLEASILAHEAAHAGVGVTLGGEFQNIEMNGGSAYTTVSGLESPEYLAMVLAPSVILGPVGIAVAKDALQKLRSGADYLRHSLRLAIGSSLVPGVKGIAYVAQQPITGPFHDFMYAAHKAADILHERFPALNQAVHDGPEAVTTLAVGAALTGVTYGIYKAGEGVLSLVERVRE